MTTPTYIHLVNANTPNLDLELNAETRLTTLGIDIGAPQPPPEDKERQLFFTRWFSKNEMIINPSLPNDFFDFIHSIHIYSSYKVYETPFKILLINLPAQQIIGHDLDYEYKLEPDDGEVWAKIPARFIDEIQEEELLEYFNDWFEELGFERFFDEDDINSDKNKTILAFISNTGKNRNVLTRLSERLYAMEENAMEENKYLKYKLKYIILKNLKNSI
jgi:hypothetical protein